MTDLKRPLMLAWATLVCAMLACLGAGSAWALDTAPMPSVALYYGAQPPWPSLQAYDEVVVDPDHVPNPAAVGLAHTRLTAYVALGEVQPSRAYASRIPPTWLIGDNQDWGSRIVDQSQSAWPAFFVREVITPLWAAGYRSFFFDTLDSYHRVSKTAAQRRTQEDGMVAVVQAVKAAYPDARLVFNRGFEILPRTHQWVAMVAAESLFQGFDAGKQRYTEVPEADRTWLLGQLNTVRNQYQLPVLAIDYVPPLQRKLARATAQRIAALGFIPFVSQPTLDSVGVGAVEPVRRRVLNIYSPMVDHDGLRFSLVVNNAAAVLNHLGLVLEHAPVDRLPTLALSDWAGVVIWLDNDPSPPQSLALQRWLTGQVVGRIPLALVHPSGRLLDIDMAQTLGLQTDTGAAAVAPVTVSHQADWVGFETPPQTLADEFRPLRAPGADVALRLMRASQTSDAVAITDWGGYALGPHAVAGLPADVGNRWVIDPFVFFARALQLDDTPAPDVTTQGGRRMLLIHMDGDGFVSRTELPGNAIAGQMVLDRVVRRYRVPMTLSVIEAEVSPQGLYPGLAAHAQDVARQIFKEPHVAMASHSYSHPFVWTKVSDRSGESGKAYNLRIPGYRFDLAREVAGSVRYMDTTLAPPGKRTEVFLWTGDCIPGDDALALTERLGLLNMNGGDTTATRSHPTLTEVEGLGLRRAGGMQVFAPNQNENVYTNNWTGPFYGFERVIETFELTELPRRLKPINIYFHTYITTKAAGMRSLDKVFAYALAQPLTPVHAADYIRQVQNFDQVSVARTPTGWRVRGARHLRTLRVPRALGWPNPAHSLGVAAVAEHAGAWYVTLHADNANLVLDAQPSTQPHLVSVNARVTQADPKALRWAVKAYVPLRWTLAHAQGCTVRLNGRPVIPVKVEGTLTHFESQQHAAGTIEAICRS